MNAYGAQLSHFLKFSIDRRKYVRIWEYASINQHGRQNQSFDSAAHVLKFKARIAVMNFLPRY
jgi:hypothetical protein